MRRAKRFASTALRGPTCSWRATALSLRHLWAGRRIWPGGGSWLRGRWQAICSLWGMAWTSAGLNVWRKWWLTLISCNPACIGVGATASNPVAAHLRKVCLPKRPMPRARANFGI